MNTEKLNLIKIPQQSIAAADSQDTDYSEFKISNGYGMIAQAGGQVTVGAEVDLDVTFKMDSISTQDFKKWLSENKSHFDDEQWHKLEENYAAGGFLGGLLAGAFGFLFGAGSYNHYKNSHDKEVKNVSDSKKGFLKSLHDTTTTKTKVEGHIKIIGQSQIPTTGCVYVQVTSIEFKDGTKKVVVDSSDPVVADPNGDPSAFKQDSSNKLSIVNI